MARTDEKSLHSLEKFFNRLFRQRGNALVRENIGPERAIKPSHRTSQLANCIQASVPDSIKRNGCETIISNVHNANALWSL